MERDVCTIHHDYSDLLGSLVTTNALISEYEAAGYDYPGFCLANMFYSFDALAGCEIAPKLSDENPLQSLQYHERARVYLQRAEIEAADIVADSIYFRRILDATASYASLGIWPKTLKGKVYNYKYQKALGAAIISRQIYASSHEADELSPNGDGTIDYLACLSPEDATKYVESKLNEVVCAKQAYQAWLEALPDYEDERARLLLRNLDMSEQRVRLGLRIVKWISLLGVILEIAVRVINVILA